MYKETRFTLAERISIAQEYLSSNHTAEELSKKYGLSSNNLIYKWCSRYITSQKYLPKSKKSSIFAAQYRFAKRKMADINLQWQEMKNR